MPLKGHVIQQHRGPYMKLIFTFQYHYSNGKDQLTNDFVIDNSAKVRFKFYDDDNKDVQGEVSAMRYPAARDSSIEMHVACESPKFSESWSCTDNWTEWKPIGVICGGIKHDESLKEGNAFAYYMFLVHINVNKVPIKIPSSYIKIHNDAKFIDFHLSVAGGEVAVHKVFLIAHSPVFNSWLSEGKWKGQTKGSIDLKEVTVQTLQDLKEYLYLRVLPSEGLLPLLLFAKTYSISNLKKDCIARLIRNVTSENLYAYLEFACRYNIPELAFAVVQRTPDDIVHDVSLKLKKLDIESEEAVKMAEGKGEAAGGQGSIFGLGLRPAPPLDGVPASASGKLPSFTFTGSGSGVLGSPTQR